MSNRTRRLVPLLALLGLLFLPALAAAQDEAASTESILSAINLVWLVVAAVLVIFMQAGFGMLEVGLSRMKNAGAVMAKIFINLGIALIMFWAVGFALGFGSGNGFIGSSGWFLPNDALDADFPFYAGYGLPIESLYLFQVAFCAVSLAIVFGSMLDRTKFAAIVVFGIVYAGLIYPIVAHWSFGGGWLFERGFLDFAGSSVVHLQGALAAAAGAIILGPRIGKFRNGRAVPIPGHSIPLALLGVLILLIGWAGFNGGSFLTVIGADGSLTNIGDIIVNTYLAAGAGVIGATIASMMLFKTIDVSQMGNGAIAGLVAITAPCFFVDAWAAIVIGVVGGLIVPPLVLAVERLKVDDPIGAIPAHGAAGIWGTLAIGFFAVPERTALALSDRSGLFYGGGGEQLWIQFYGMAATVGFTFAASALVFLGIKYTIGLRVSEEAELSGLDISEHGMYGYPERFIDVPGATPEDGVPTTRTSSPAGATTAGTTQPRGAES